MRLIADDEQGRDLGRALVPIPGADQREAAPRFSCARSQDQHRTDRSRMPEKTHTESCRAAASLFFWVARLASNSAGGK